MSSFGTSQFSPVKNTFGIEAGISFHPFEKGLKITIFGWEPDFIESYLIPQIFFVSFKLCFLHSSRSASTIKLLLKLNPSHISKNATINGLFDFGAFLTVSTDTLFVVVFVFILESLLVFVLAVVLVLVVVLLKKSEHNVCHLDKLLEILQFLRIAPWISEREL